MGKRPSFVACENPAYVSFSVNVFLPNNTSLSLYYFAAILNSKLLWYWYLHNAKKRGIGLEINGNVLSKSPIKNIDFSNEKEKDIYEKLIDKSKKLHEIQLEMSITKSINDKNICNSMLYSINVDIDKLIFDLYDINSDDIKLIDGEINAIL